MTSTSNQSGFASSSPSTLRVPWLIALGVAFWFLAAMMVRFIGSFVFIEGSITLVLTFALTIPMAWAFFWLGKALSGARGADLLPAVSILTFVALCLDGVALTWFRELYGPTYAYGGPWIMWGAGLILMVALLHTQRHA